jgi:photosystem II stability/assembly factor-like uncharacterized protein
VTSASMPAAFVRAAQLYNSGVYEIQVAPSNSSILYMVYPVYRASTYPPLSGIYKSTDKGVSWTQTSFAPVKGPTVNANGPYRPWGPRMAISPTNPNVVYVGTGANGFFVTTDGGTTWSAVSGIPPATADRSGNYPGITGIVFNPSNTNTIFAASYGNGIYESNDGGTSWSKINGSGGPTTVFHAAASSNGTYLVIDGRQDLWVYADGTWRQRLSSVTGVTVDPKNPDHVIAVSYDGNLNESLTSGTTWSGWSDTSGRRKPRYVANDIPWQIALGTLSAQGILFDKSAPGKLYVNGQNDFWTTTLSGVITANTPITWYSQGVGIEQLVANEVISPPISNSTPLLASWDRAVFSPNLSAYPSTFGPVADGWVVAGWSVDYASSNPNFIALLADGDYAGGPQRSSYSTDGGRTWTRLPSMPFSTFAGNIAVSTPSNFIVGKQNAQPYYTLDGGVTWHPISLPGISNWSRFIGPFFVSTRAIAADRVLPNTFYLLFEGKGIFRTTDGGVSWTQVNRTVSPGFAAQLKTTPGVAGDLWISDGFSDNPGSQPAGGNLRHSTDGGATWTTVSGVREPYTIGFGAPARGQSYPAVYIVGWINSVYGIWESDDAGQRWKQIGLWPLGSLDYIKTISGDMNQYGRVYVGFQGSGYAFGDTSGLIRPASEAPRSQPGSDHRQQR